MIVLFAAALLIIGLLAILPIRLSGRNGKISWWHYGFPFSGVICWFLLAVLEVGSTISLSNFVIEMFWVTIVSVLAPWIYFALSFIKAGPTSLIRRTITAVPLGFTIGLRLMIRTLPE